MEATRHPAAAVTRRLQDDPDQTGQESQSCSQEEVEEGWGEQGGMGPAVGGDTVEEEAIEMLVSPNSGSVKTIYLISYWSQKIYIWATGGTEVEGQNYND